MTYLSLVVYNRELVVINDMDTFAQYYCYLKKQKPGLVTVDKANRAVEEVSDEAVPAIIYESIEPVESDDDIL